MIKILVKKNEKFIETVTVEDNPSLGTRGNLLLLKEHLKLQDAAWIKNSPNKFRQLEFNTKFLTDMLEKHGELHCEYCGLEGLKIIPWNVHKSKKDYYTLATTDHFYSKQEARHLAFDFANCRVACFKSNNNKKTHIWECKHPYLEHEIK